MKLKKQLFLAIISNPNPAIISTLDRTSCGCGYCYWWVYHLNSGKWNPMLTEMDMELKDIKTAEDLYEFVKQKTNALQGNKQSEGSVV